MNISLAGGTHLHAQHVQLAPLLVNNDFGQMDDSELGNTDDGAESLDLRVCSYMLLQVEMPRCRASIRLPGAIF